MQNIIKLDAAGAPLPADATNHVAVQIGDLTWLVAPVTKKAVTHEKAEAEVAKLDALGHTDWRLPTSHELFGIVDHSRHAPAIDTDLFPGTKADWYWTGTRCAWSPSALAWIVNFYYGYVYHLHRGYDAFVRAVRGGVPAGQ